MPCLQGSGSRRKPKPRSRYSGHLHSNCIKDCILSGSSCTPKLLQRLSTSVTWLGHPSCNPPSCEGVRLFNTLSTRSTSLGLSAAMESLAHQTGVNACGCGNCTTTRRVPGTSPCSSDCPNPVCLTILTLFNCHSSTLLQSLCSVCVCVVLCMCSAIVR